jgi:hypothetical protein
VDLLALRRRIGERKPVIWLLKEQYHLFVEEGVYKMPDEFQDIFFKTFVWTLVDDDALDNGIPQYLIPSSMRLYVIYIISSAVSKWSRMEESLSLSVFVMNLWTKRELYQV